VDSTSYLVAFSDPGSRRLLLWHVPLDHAIVRNPNYGGRQGLRLLNIETEIILPGWADPAIFNGRTFRVVYLQDTSRALKNEAIDIEILSGEHSGYHEFLDARPFGKWIGIPVGAAFLGFGLMGLKYMKDDAQSAASDEDDSPST
jgi:hypothetical protein